MKTLSSFPSANAGSEQGKKRKRQDSTKEAPNEGAKEDAAKQKKKVKLGGQVRCDEKNNEEPKANILSTKKREENMPVAKKGGKENITRETGKIVLNQSSLLSFPQTPAYPSATLLSSYSANQILPSKIWKVDDGKDK